MMRKIKKILLPILKDLEAFLKPYLANRSFSKLDRLGALTAVLSVMMVLIVAKLFVLQVVDYEYYATLASDQHEIRRILHADRGEILAKDYAQENQEFPLALNKSFYQIYSVPKQIENPEEVVEKLSDHVSMADDQLLASLSKEDDPYEPIERKVSQDRYERIKALEIPGIYGIEETYRYYVDDNIGSNILGFVGLRNEEPTGLYGIEGFFEDDLAGKPGFIQTERDVAGRWIALSDKRVEESTDGADILLTIDRTLQFQVCDELNRALLSYDAKGGSVVVLEPQTGRILAMCSAPDFDPNNYGDVESAAQYNNKATFEAYEPGSVFKPFVMAAAVDLQKVNPDSTYIDEGFVDVDEFTIRNAQEKVYGEQTMTQVLENSINTGMIHVARLMGRQAMADYLYRFGFGEKTGIELDTEVAGNVSSLEKTAESYLATASFGQGLTTTPLQLATAYGAIANGGTLMKPYIVEEIRYPDGRVETRHPTPIRQVISSRSSVLMTGMLTSVVSNGQAGNAAIPGYYVAGKTGTAQVAGAGGAYKKGAFNHSFIGYAPADNPKAVIVVKLEEPSSAPFAASTSARVFQSIASFILNYYEVEPDYTR